MKIGFVTDLHFRAAVPGTSGNPKRECRRAGELLRRALAAFQEARVDLVVCGGDNIDAPHDDPRIMDDVATLASIFAESGLPTMVVHGNHDPEPESFFRVFPEPPLVSRWEDCEWITFAAGIGDQADRLRELVRDNPPGVPHTFLFQHYVLHPPHDSENAQVQTQKAALRTILEQSPRRLFALSGHRHNGYPRSCLNGVTYFTGRALCEHPYTYYLLRTDSEAVVIQEHTLA